MELDNIKQVKLTAEQAINNGIFEGQNEWFTKWAKEYPTESVYAYFVNEKLIWFALVEPTNLESKKYW